jgi:hypothetical protein
MRGTVFRPDFSGSGKRLGITGYHVGGSGDAENWLVEHDGERRKRLPRKSKNVLLGWKRKFNGCKPSNSVHHNKGEHP